MASEATQMAVRCNMHMDTRVIKVAGFKFEVRSDLRGCLEAVMASEITKMAVRCNIHMDIRIIKFAGLKSKIKLDL